MRTQTRTPTVAGHPRAAASARRGRRIRVLIVAVVVLGLVEVGVRVLLPTPLRTDGYPSRDVMLKLAQIDERSDGLLPTPSIVLAGSSVVQRGLDPAVISRTSDPQVSEVYNAALRASSIADTSFWLREVVVPALRPDVVVIGLSDFGLTHGDCTLCFETNLAARVRTGDATVVARAANQISWLFRYRATLQRPSAARQSVRDAAVRNVENMDELGFAPFTPGSGNPTGPGAEVPADFAAGSVALEELIVWLQAEGITPVMVEIPVLAAVDSGRYEALVTSWRIVAAAHGVEMIDPPADMYDAVWFADPAHLNQDGATALSVHVRLELLRLGLLAAT